MDTWSALGPGDRVVEDDAMDMNRSTTAPRHLRHEQQVRRRHDRVLGLFISRGQVVVGKATAYTGAAGEQIGALLRDGPLLRDALAAHGTGPKEGSGVASLARSRSVAQRAANDVSVRAYRLGASAQRLVCVSCLIPCIHMKQADDEDDADGVEWMGGGGCGRWGAALKEKERNVAQLEDWVDGEDELEVGLGMQETAGANQPVQVSGLPSQLHQDSSYGVATRLVQVLCCVDKVVFRSVSPEDRDDDEYNAIGEDEEGGRRLHGAAGSRPGGGVLTKLVTALLDVLRVAINALRVVTRTGAQGVCCGDRPLPCTCWG